MPVTSSEWRQFEEVSIKKLEAGLKNRNKQAYYNQYVDVSSTNKLVERENDIENMGGLQFWAEGSARPELMYQVGWPQSYHQHQWSGLVEITKPMSKFGKSDLVRRLYSQLADASKITKELIGTYYLEYGHTTTVPSVGGIPIVNVLGGDGLALFHATHVYKNGAQTWSNYSSSSEDLTEATVNSNTLVIRRWKDNKGSPLMVQPKRVIIPPDLEMKYIRISKSMKQPDSNNNAVNTTMYFIGKDDPLINPWLSDTVDWYIETDAKDSGIIFYFGWPDEVNAKATNPRTGNIATSVDFSIAHGHHNGRRYYAVK